MAKRSVLDHPKFTELQDALSQPKGAVLGWLECLWHFTAKFTPQGNIGKYSDKQIERWLEWNGEAGALLQALVNCGWVDQSEQHRLVIHDWHDHCDDATKKALARSRLQFITSESNTLQPLSGKIYAIKTEKSDMVKIGFTETTVQSRVEALQTGCPDKLVVLGVKSGTKNEERLYHEKYKHLRTSGEWFTLSNDILDEVQQWQPLSDNGVLPEPSLAMPSHAGAASDDASPPRPASPFEKPPKPFANVNPIARYPEPVQTASRDALDHWHFWAHGCLANVHNETTAKDLNRLAAAEESQPGTLVKRIKGFVAKPPPGWPRDSPLFKVLKHLGYDAPLASAPKAPQLPRQVLKDYTAERLAKEKDVA